MKKVLLVNTNTEQSPYPVPPLGLCLIAGVLENNYAVKIYDGAFDAGNGLHDAIDEFAPDYIGVSIRNIDDMDLLDPTNYIDPIRENFIQPIRNSTGAPLILGGSAFSIFPEYFMTYYGADYGIFGEAEAAFAHLLHCLDGGGDVSAIPSVLTKNSKKYHRRLTDFPMEHVPFSNIDLRLDYSPYRARSSYPVQTKRGCSHRCVYCTYNCIEGYRYRTRPPELIAEEIRQAAGRLGQVTFEFVDSTFNDPPGHAEAVCREIIRLGLSVRLRTMGINPCNASPELFGLMRDAGFAQIDCTPDTASPSMLATLGKNFTLADLKNAARIIREADMPTMWFFIFGGPGETEETVMESFEFIDTCISAKDMVHMTCGMRIYPGTVLHRRALEDGMVGTDDDLTGARFYISPAIGKERLLEIIKTNSLSRPNCVPVMETTPSPEMMREAIRMREEGRLTEPMFRTLLRLRYRMFGKEMD
ncbi:MAG TPA: radical SAM protein [Spirochaetota bacterium]|nr:radical SAM protein [Spirochaetota bacterium]HPC42951.1 radical SAM protein [Spirochaetota bacterium]HPL18803.1 radical SAM protein [Spirochaetota bacterium]HQF07634.1 radical SAM protein [Spirochaetota bacterium]HQH96365.1 radical SAM protein [Spirochaetota bacterium]